MSSYGILKTDIDEGAIDLPKLVGELLRKRVKPIGRREFARSSDKKHATHFRLRLGEDDK